MFTRKMDPLVATGHSLALGGALLIPAGLLMGAHPVGVRLKGLLILAALVAVSAVGFSFYNQLLRYHPVGQIAIYNAFIPVLGWCSPACCWGSLSPGAICCPAHW